MSEIEYREPNGVSQCSSRNQLGWSAAQARCSGCNKSDAGRRTVGQRVHFGGQRISISSRESEKTCGKVGSVGQLAVLLYSPWDDYDPVD